MCKEIAFAMLLFSGFAIAQTADRQVFGSMQEQFTALMGFHVKLIRGDTIDLKIENVSVDQFCGHVYEPQGKGPWVETNAMCVPFSAVKRLEYVKENLDRVYL